MRCCSRARCPSPSCPSSRSTLHPDSRCISLAAPSSRRGTSNRSSFVRSCSKRVATAAVLLFVAALACGAEPSPTGAFTQKEVTAALEALRKDPDLARERTITGLKWVESEADKKKKSDMGWLKWFGEMFGWM